MIKTFYFNDLRTACHILYDGSGKCVIVDPGCYSDDEKNRVVKFIAEHGLTPEKILLTHGHFDHVMGCSFAASKWDIPVYMNLLDLSQIERATSYGDYFGYTFEAPPTDVTDIQDGDTITFGNTVIKAFHTPGHTKGGMIFYNEAGQYVLTGDSLFAGSIGRTDLPEGDYDLLLESLRDKILTLPPDTVVYPGHGPTTTIATENTTNPFLEPLR